MCYGTLGFNQGRFLATSLHSLPLAPLDSDSRPLTLRGLKHHEEVAVGWHSRLTEGRAGVERVVVMCADRDVVVWDGTHLTEGRAGVDER